MLQTALHWRLYRQSSRKFSMQRVGFPKKSDVQCRSRHRRWRLLVLTGWRCRGHSTSKCSH
eukprot:721334-Karenia_brevis.AAC.1